MDFPQRLINFGVYLVFQLVWSKIDVTLTYVKDNNVRSQKIREVLFLVKLFIEIILLILYLLQQLIAKINISEYSLYQWFIS